MTAIGRRYLLAAGAVLAIGVVGYYWGSSAPYLDWNIPQVASSIGRTCASWARGDYFPMASLSVFAAALIGGIGGTMTTAWSALKLSRRAAVICGVGTFIWFAAIGIGYMTHAPNCVLA